MRAHVGLSVAGKVLTGRRGHIDQGSKLAKAKGHKTQQPHERHKCTSLARFHVHAGNALGCATGQ